MTIVTYSLTNGEPISTHSQFTELEIVNSKVLYIKVDMHKCRDNVVLSAKYLRLYNSITATYKDHPRVATVPNKLHALTNSTLLATYTFMGCSVN